MRHPIVAKAERAAEWRDHLRARCRRGPDRKAKKQLVLVSQVIVSVCEYYGITPAQLKDRGREGETVRARQIGMYVARKLTDRSRPQIGREFGGFDNSTVIHAERKVAALLTTNPEVRTDVDAISGGALSGW